MTWLSPKDSPALPEELGLLWSTCALSVEDSSLRGSDGVLGGLHLDEVFRLCTLLQGKHATLSLEMSKVADKRDTINIITTK